MIVCAHQPGYLPYIGFFNKIMQSDIFVFCDHLQYVKKEYHNRNRIRTLQKDWMWLTVPIHSTEPLFQKIMDVKIDNSNNWGKNHWVNIISNYAKSPFFGYYKSFFEELYQKKWEKLVDLNETIIMYILKELRINVKIVKGSDLHLEGKKTDLLIDTCKKLNADSYLSGIGGYEYLEEQKFKENNITLFYQNFHHPIYPQRYEPFIPNMSVIDLLFNMGSEKSRKIILDSGGMTSAAGRKSI